MIDNNKIKVVYMGTPGFAVPPLRALAKEGYDIKAVVSQPDKAKNRGKKIAPTEVKVVAEQLGIKVLQPDRIKDNDIFYEELKEEAPDIIVVAAYGKILPQRILKLPKFGCVNIHASLLPRYRGAAPIQRSIIEGEEETGVTLMFMEEGLDTGDMIAKAKTSIGNKTAEELSNELAEMGAKLLINNLPGILEGTIEREIQNDEESSYAPILLKADGKIDFNKSAFEIERLIRGMDPWPGTYADFDDNVMKIWGALAEDKDSGLAPGTVIGTGKRGIEVACGKGTLVITRIQMPGKNVMSAYDFLLGREIKPGTVLK